MAILTEIPTTTADTTITMTHTIGNKTASHRETAVKVRKTRQYFTTHSTIVNLTKFYNKAQCYTVVQYELCTY